MNGISEMPCFKNYYTTDTLPYRIVKNRGERTSYYVENNHPPIVARADFERVQQMLQREAVLDARPKTFFPACWCVQTAATASAES